MFLMNFSISISFPQRNKKVVIKTWHFSPRPLCDVRIFQQIKIVYNYRFFLQTTKLLTVMNHLNFIKKTKRNSTLDNVDFFTSFNNIKFLKKLFAKIYIRRIRKLIKKIILKKVQI